jgi:hypothetical protein
MQAISDQIENKILLTYLSNFLFRLELHLGFDWLDNIAFDDGCLVPLANANEGQC